MAKTTGEIELLDPKAETTLVLRENPFTPEFMKRAEVFFGNARELEASARLTLTRAKRLKVPSNDAEAERLRKSVNAWRDEKKAIEAHWSITKVVTDLRNRLTGHRGRATGYIDDAVKIATGKLREFANAREKERQKALAKAERKGTVATNLPPPAKGLRKHPKAVVVDEAKFIAAVIEGKLGIPASTLTVNQAVLDDYARRLGKQVTNWPGIGYTETESMTR